jgi:hypothetical protein
MSSLLKAQWAADKAHASGRQLEALRDDAEKTAMRLRGAADELLGPATQHLAALMADLKKDIDENVLDLERADYVKTRFLARFGHYIEERSKYLQREAIMTAGAVRGLENAISLFKKEADAADMLTAKLQLLVEAEAKLGEDRARPMTFKEKCDARDAEEAAKADSAEAEVWVAGAAQEESEPEPKKLKPRKRQPR